MKIAVVDVAAESGGALSVLLDFINFIEGDFDFCRKNQWIIYTSRPVVTTKNNVRNIVVNNIKKSWVHRIIWEQFKARKTIESEGVDLVISLQNTALKRGKYKQYVYFHNILLLESPNKYSILKAEERKYAIYTRLIAPYTLHSLRNAQKIIVQTNTVKSRLLDKLPNIPIDVVSPNIALEKKYYNSVELPIKGLVYPTSAVPFKQIEEIIHCVDKFNGWFYDNRFEVLLTIHGNENEYAERIYKIGLKHKDIIRFIGVQEKNELFELYKKYGLLICSELESFSLPIVEAGYVGTPIVAAKYPYSIERTQKFNNVFLYMSGNIDNMMNAIKMAHGVETSANNKVIINGNTWNKIKWYA